jgi:uncharacterized membrane protein
MKKIGLIFLISLFNLGQATAQCAMCRASVESTMSNGRNYVATGLNTGIFYLFVIPYLLIVVVGYLWYKSSLKARTERLAIQRRVQAAMSN